jgi:hypothetical protein
MSTFHWLTKSETKLSDWLAEASIWDMWLSQIDRDIACPFTSSSSWTRTAKVFKNLFRYSFWRCSWSLHLCRGRPKTPFPSGWYLDANCGMRFLFILCKWQFHFFWYNFISSSVLSTSNFWRIAEFLWWTNLVKPNNGLKNLICAASNFCASLIYYPNVTAMQKGWF